MSGPETITDYQAECLIDEFSTESQHEKLNRRNSRNELLILLMLDAGLRVSETILLTINDLCLRGEPRHSVEISVQNSKSKDSRIIPLSDRIRNATMRMWACNWTPHDFEVNAFAFAGTLPTRPITARQVERIVGGAAQRAFGRWIHPHILRHTFASKLMRTCSSRVVQELLGHRHLTSTQVYMHPNENDKKLAIESLQKGVE